MPAQPLGPTGLLAQSMTLPAGSQSLNMGGMGLRAQGMDGRKKGGATGPAFVGVGFSDAQSAPFSTFLPAQTQVGDLVILLGTRNGSDYPPSNSATWNALSASMPATGGWFGWKIWTASDFAATTGVTGNVPSTAVWVWRGIKSATMRLEFGDASGGGTSGQTLNIGSFSKSASPSLCGLFVVSTADGSPQPRALSTPASLASALKYAPANQVPISQQYAKLGGYTLSPAAYSSGGSIIYDLGNTNWNQAVVQVVELFS